MAIFLPFAIVATDEDAFGGSAGASGNDEPTWQPGTMVQTEEAGGGGTTGETGGEPGAGGLSDTDRPAGQPKVTGIGITSAGEAGSEILQIRKMLPVGEGVWYGIARKRGLLYSGDGGGTWEERNNGLPARVVYPFREGEVKDLTSLAVSWSDPNQIAVTTSFGLYHSGDGGLNFTAIPLRMPLKESAYVTCAALDPASDKTFLVGTSFSGFFETRDGGRTWRNLSERITSLHQGAGFYEEIAAAVYLPGGRELLVALGFGQGLYSFSRTNGAWQKLPQPEEGSEIRALYMMPGEETLYLQTEKALYRTILPGYTWERLPPESRLVGYTPRPPLTGDRIERQKKAAGKTGIYINSFYATGSRLTAHLDFLVSHGLNSFVLDMKDDDGFVTYDTSLEMPRKIGAVRRRFQIREVLEKAHERNLYVIARIVVFKDKQFYNYKNNAYAVWNQREGKPWANMIPVTNGEGGETSYEQREFWVDPFSREVWDYNLSLALELAELGVDEIQFDYIRFPSDGDLSKAVYRHQRTGMGRIEALESFLVLARERISIPISTDLYGFNSWYRMGNWIGQNLEMVSEYVDVVSPMFYPSHFPSQFLKEMAYLDRAEWIYREGTRRSQSIAAGRALIRPYVQAFLIGGELRMEAPTYTEYLLRQLKGSREASGFTLWNASNRYYMVTVPLEEFTRPSNGAEE